MFDGNTLTVGDVVTFADIWQSNVGNELEVLESNVVWVGNNEDGEPICAEFEIITKYQSPMNTLCKIKDIF